MKQSGLGIASMILGIIGLLTSCLGVGIVFCIVGLVLAIICIVNKQVKHGMGIAGLVCSIVGIVVFVFMLLIPPDDDSDKATSKKGSVAETQQEQESETDAKSGSETFKVGDVVETEDLRITFLSADTYKDEYSTPKDGHKFMRMEFEFENISDSDQYVSSYDWDCYADSYSVDQTWMGDDDLDATLSPGKKVKGSVYFEIPKDSKDIELAYETNFWTEDKVVFIVK